MKNFALSILCLTPILCGGLAAQSQPANTALVKASAVPKLVNYGGVLTDADGKPASGVMGVTFLLYKDEQGGAPLWMETQNVTVSRSGKYSVTLGSTKPEGLPADVFISGEARWLALQADGQPEKARVLLVAVPYALKASDAETIGGLPPSAFVLALPANTVGTAAAPSQDPTANTAAPPASSVTTSGGTINALPLWTTATNIQSSTVTQTGTGATAKIGIGTTTPATTLDVKGGATLRGAVTLPATAAATAAAGKSSQPQSLVASSFSSSTTTAVNQTFKWQAEPAANNTATPSGTLNLLYGLGASPPTETGLLISSKGLLTFAPGQTFPGSATGTVKSVGLTAPSSDFTVSGSPVTTTGTLSFNWKVAPSSANSANAIVKRDAVGSINVSGVTGTETFLTETAGPYGTLSSTTYPTGIAVFGHATSPTGLTIGVEGITDSLGTGGAAGVFGFASNADPNAGPSQGVTGQTMSHDGIGVLGLGASLTATSTGLIGNFPAGVWGDHLEFGVLATSDNGNAVWANNNSFANATIALFNDGPGDLLDAVGSHGFGCDMDGLGNFTCTGVLTGAGKDFKIDHPLDPANKYLVHASIESPDMKTVYDGVALLEADGQAWVKLPAYVEALNGDFRYQLTCLGAFAPVYIAQEISNNQFQIAGGKSGMKVSWQLTGIRRDAYAKAHPLVVEAEKQGDERGHYLHPEDFGQPNQLGVGTVRREKEKMPHVPRKVGSAPVPK